MEKREIIEKLLDYSVTYWVYNESLITNLVVIERIILREGLFDVELVKNINDMRDDLVMTEKSIYYYRHLYAFIKKMTTQQLIDYLTSKNIL